MNIKPKALIINLHYSKIQEIFDNDGLYNIFDLIKEGSEKIDLFSKDFFGDDEKFDELISAITLKKNELNKQAVLANLAMAEMEQKYRDLSILLTLAKEIINV